MIIKRKAVAPFDFQGLSICDYTAGKDSSSSLAIIEVPAGGRHQRAYSKRSDKYYYLVSGKVRFTVGKETSELEEGDLLIIAKGEHFSYENPFAGKAVLLLFHTPSFDLSSEVLLGDSSTS